MDIPYSMPKWRMVLHILPATDKIGMLIVPLATIAYISLIAADILIPDAIAVGAISTGILYLISRIALTTRLLERGEFIPINAFRVGRPKNDKISHLFQVDYEYEFEGLLYSGSDYFAKCPAEVDLMTAMAIVDPKKPSKSLLFLIDK